mmetsp:Transcript_32031/g.100450  ORF Transcript_32031/g.100450 Transcript_32031/m.100450 type:complete len:401 (+) Transcript_32031:106-1308(+)
MIRSENLRASQQQEVQEQAVEAHGLPRNRVVQAVNFVGLGAVAARDNVAGEVVPLVSAHLIERAHSPVTTSRFMADATDQGSASRMRTTRCHDWAAALPYAVEVALRAAVPRDTLSPHGLVDQLPLVPVHAGQEHRLQVCRPVQCLVEETSLRASGRQADHMECQREEALRHGDVAQDLPAVLPQGPARAGLLAVWPVASALHPPELQLHLGCSLPPVQVQLQPVVRPLLGVLPPELPVGHEALHQKRGGCGGHGGPAAGKETLGFGAQRAGARQPSERRLVGLAEQRREGVEAEGAFPEGVHLVRSGLAAHDAQPCGPLGGESQDLCDPRRATSRVEGRHAMLGESRRGTLRRSAPWRRRKLLPPLARTAQRGCVCEERLHLLVASAPGFCHAAQVLGR